MIWTKLQVSPPPRLASRQARRSEARMRRATRRGGFTLIEIMVALAIFLVMLSIIFVPLNLGINLFSIGKTRTNVMQAAQNTMDSIERDLSQAVFVFPNEALRGVTYEDGGPPPLYRTPRPPYSNAGIPVNPSGSPYIRVENSGEGTCDATPPIGDTDPTDYVDNPHRLEFLLPDTFYGGVDNIQPAVPLRAAPYLVSYYYRRQDPTIVADPFDNPIILFRARMPYREHNGNTVMDTTNPNVVVSSARYPNPASIGCTSGKTATNRGSFWLDQSNQYNEPNLQPLCYTSDQGPDSGSVNASPYEPITGAHIPVLPKGIALIARNAFSATPDFTPDTTFRCADTNGDGKIDQVTVTLVIGSYDDNGADRSNRRANDGTSAGVSDQRYRLSQTINIRNVK